MPATLTTLVFSTPLDAVPTCRYDRQCRSPEALSAVTAP